MNIKSIKVSEKGQIAIPMSIRLTMGIKKGDELILLQKDGKILIEKPQKIIDNLQNDFQDLVKFSEDSLKEVWDNKEDDVWDVYLEDEN